MPSSTPTTPTQSTTFFSNNTKSNPDPIITNRTPSRKSSSSSTSEERGPETPPITHPNSPYSNSSTSSSRGGGGAYPRLPNTPFATDPLDPASRRGSTNALRASVLNVFVELGAVNGSNSQYTDWMFGGLPGWEEGQQNSYASSQNPPTNIRSLGAGVRFQSGSRFRERLDSRGSSMALLDGYIRLTRNAGGQIREGSESEEEEEEEEEEERGWARSTRFFKSGSKSRTRSKSRQRKDTNKERDIKFKDAPVIPRGGGGGGGGEGEAGGDRSAKRKSVWRKSLRASGYESDGAAVSVSTSLKRTFTKSTKPNNNAVVTHTRKEDISRPLPQRRSGVPSGVNQMGPLTPTTPSSSGGGGSTSKDGKQQQQQQQQPTTEGLPIPSYTTPFPLLTASLAPLTRSSSHDDANPRTNRQSLQTLNTLNTLVLEEAWDKVDPLTTVDFQTLDTFENPFVGTGKLKKKPPKGKKQRGRTSGRDYRGGDDGDDDISPDLPPVPVVVASGSGSGFSSGSGSGPTTPNKKNKKPRKNPPNMIELPLQDQGAPIPVTDTSTVSTPRTPLPFPGVSTTSEGGSPTRRMGATGSDGYPGPQGVAATATATATATPSLSVSEANASDGHSYGYGHGEGGASVGATTGGSGVGASGSGSGGGGGLFSRLARPFLSSQTSSKRSIKISKATQPPAQVLADANMGMSNMGMGMGVGSGPTTPKSTNTNTGSGGGRTPRTPQSPVNVNQDRDRDRDRVSEDSVASNASNASNTSNASAVAPSDVSDRLPNLSTASVASASSRPGTPLSPLSRALERGSLEEAKMRKVPPVVTSGIGIGVGIGGGGGGMSRSVSGSGSINGSGSGSRGGTVPPTPSSSVAFPRVSTESNTEVGGWRGGVESGWVD
ncbi:hypothetical protein K435DRAFT_417434 [Dendrothele bispora CBS 962.96]|uniref:Uncharacterized protein n=1 Tax=Dendrothele bispora (strain CBS 962.96) TaxID=1314807 RepID=A0A4S8MUK3_DENBC|nr:hypothetical protein K435DRAFT_417434 [Dendrothele bispora CBS 962.96]